MPKLALVMSSQRTCAYCGSQKNLTREHIIPKFVYARDSLKGREMQISNVLQGDKDKAVQTEITIADVCASCNNSFLAELDSYGSKLYDDFFDHIPQSGCRIKFEYKYDFLVRWLLKMAYNAGRSRKWRPLVMKHLEAARPFICGRASCPDGVRVYLQLVKSAKLTESQKKALLEKSNQSVSELEPGFRRLAAFVVAGMSAGCLVGINGYQFYIVFCGEGRTSWEITAVERKFLRGTPGAKYLTPGSTSAVIFSSSLNIVDVVLKNPLMRRNIEEGATWVQARSAKKKVT